MAQAQDARNWIGKLVAPKYAGFKLTLEKRSVHHDEWTVYRVKEVAGRRLMLEIPGRGLRGWALARDVVPRRRSVFTRR
jgi:hypothetical protein